ncbi:MAG: DUF6268 family outer membrane beta-barrel protein [Burkholderiales bacterium]
MPMRLPLLPAAALACLPLLSSAQDVAPGTVVTNASLSGLAQFDTSLDGGGRFHWNGAIASGSVYRQFAPQFGAGLTLTYDWQQWSFDSPTRLGPVAPWRDLYQPQVGATLMYAFSEDVQMMVMPSVSWAYASGASTGDALNYGAVAILSRDFTPKLTLGLGAAVYRQIDRTRVFPFVAIDWQIDDRWRLANPFSAGPTGGAGVELTYKAADDWQVGFGGTYRSYAFRLAQDGPVPDGIGENTSIPLFLRLSRNIGKQAQVDLYAAALANGTLKVKNRNGDDLATADYDVAPLVALTLRYRF